ncbi:alpha-hydroxy-acid oxidizing protein [bacterium]|nr:alpha-hydroxy-acid oxidizing protein [bacterium]
MGQYQCEVCEYVYDEEKSGQLWVDVSKTIECPVCGSPEDCFECVTQKIAEEKQVDDPSGETKETTIDLKKSMAETEIHFMDIHEMAETGSSVFEPMRTKMATLSWDEILIKGAQLAKIPLNHEDPVNTKTIIGPQARLPLTIDTPVFVTHMSFGALSQEAKIALAKGSAACKTAICSGEGGILPESINQAHKYIFEYVPNQYSVTPENLKKVDAIEIKIGQSAKPGMGGHLPADKVTLEVANIRGREQGKEIVSPSHFKDILTADDLKNKVDWLREESLGRPIGIKIAAGNLEADLGVCLHAGPDFITIDGRTGATGSASKFVKASTSIPTIFALYRARKFLDENGAKDISLVITGGLRVSSDFAKALAIGADAIAIGTTALMAIGCQQYRICNTGKCPMGIATQDPLLRSRLNIEEAAKRLENYLKVTTDELSDFARLTGNDDLHKLSVTDLCTSNSEISNYTSIEHV